MFNIQSATETLNQEIAALKFDRKPEELYDPVKYILNLGGKRLRPMLTLLGCYAYNDSYQSAIKPSLAVELFHNFSLIHDDIMDEAPLRRGMQTVHKKWNHNIALLAGDVTLIEAYEMLEFVAPELRWEIFKLFNLTAKQVCEGQQFDMNFEKKERVAIAQYIEMIELKTAVLLGFSFYMGARIGGSTMEDAQKLYAIAINIGIGFQIKDDYLDVYGEVEKFGKQVGGDILANKKTYLLLTALENADAESLSRLKLLLTTNVLKGADKINEVMNIYNKLKVGEKTQKTIESYFETALLLLDNLQINDTKKEFLAQYFKGIMGREN